MKIGITIDITLSIKTSTKNQLIILMADVLKRAGNQCFLITNRSFNPKQSSRSTAYDAMRSGHFLAKFDPHEKNPLQLDACIEAGFQYEKDVALALKKKNRNCKFILFSFEDQYFFDAIACVKTKESEKGKGRTFNEVWTWNHLSRTLPYLQAVYRCKGKTVPFIWESKFINKDVEILKKNNASPFYSDERENVVCILEENKSPIETCLPALAICENLNFSDPEIISKINVTNAQLLKKNSHFIDIFSKFKILDPSLGKVHLNNKWNNTDALSRWGKCIISHNMLGDVSVRNLESIYLRYPLIHNAEDIKDFGYYYNIKNIEHASKLLKYALTMHKENEPHYNTEAQKILTKYSPYSQDNISQFKLAINE